MNFKNRAVLFLRIILFPFSIIYGCVIRIRNFLFDKKILHSTGFNMPVICVGNLSAGGSGKTPMVEYLIKIMQRQNLQTATVSRGYRRKTKGFLLADNAATASEIGDEPMQFHNKFPDINVCVGEDRVNAVNELLKIKNNINSIILDDAFQHRKIKAGLNILLTDYNNLFYNDYFLPTGNLRDQRVSSKRADIIVVTKSPFGLSAEQKKIIGNRISRYNGKPVFFAGIHYGNPYHINTSEEFVLDNQHHYILVHGIANADPLRNYVQSFEPGFEEINFPDHHDYSETDIQKITKTYRKQSDKHTIILTTEKDAVKLKAFIHQLFGVDIYVLPIEYLFLFNKKQEFDLLIRNFIRKYNP